MFSHDRDLHAHLAELQPKPTPPARPKRTPKASAKRSAGIVTFYDARRGFGFAKDDSGESIFVGARSIAKAEISNLTAGDKISFAVEKTKKGPAAIDIELLDHAPAPTTTLHQCPCCDAIGKHRWDCELAA
jgi:cold shock CspA family protein